MSFNVTTKAKERIRIDEVEIKINIKEIDSQLKTKLCEVVKQECEDKDLINEKIESIKKGSYQVNELITLLNDESLARIKRTVSYLYLQYLLDNAEDKQSESYKLAYRYVQRFVALERYLEKLADLPDEKAKIQVGIDSVNLCDLLYEGNAFESLPLIGIVKGVLLEDRGTEEKIFKLALKMKLNGAVQKEEGITSLEYHLKQIEELKKKREKNKKRVKIFFLYTFMLDKLDDESVDPVKNWKAIKCHIKEQNFDEVTTEFINKYRDKEHEIYKIVEKIEKLFIDIIKYNTSELQYKSHVYTKSLILYKGILNSDIEGVRLLRPFEQFKEYLKYVSIVEDNKEENENKFKNTLLNIPIHITIQSKSLYEKGATESTKLIYKIEDLKVLPIVMYPDLPIDQKNILDNIWNQIKSIYHIRIPYMLPSKKGGIQRIKKDDIQKIDGFLYTVIYLTIGYLVLDKVFRSIKGIDSKQLYIPITRLHTIKQLKEHAYLGEYIRDISKTLEHLLGVTYRATSQGFEIDKKDGAYWAYRNAVSSMYSRIPKQFDKNYTYSIDKAAIIVVTSRKTDNKQLDKEQLSEEQIRLLIGEVILFDKDEKDNIICDSWKTFSDYYKDEDLYKRPKILKDLVNELYQNGYHKIIYIAKAPYTSKLNITSQMKSMYFMDESIVEMMKENKKDLMIYPLYFEQFSAIDYKNQNTKEALYVSDTREIDEHLTPNNQSIAGVLNLYSGKSVGNTNNQKKYYRSVMLYSTLCNIYQDKQMNEALYEGLVNETTLKTSLIETLIMLHYARYEATNAVNIKINPYERIIGDDSVSARSIQTFKINNFNLRFNMLAYLTDVKKITDKE